MLAKTIYGGAGNDRIDGSSGHDALYGDDGDDHITAGTGHDTLEGGTGNDILRGDGVGGTGVDTYSYLFDDLTDGTEFYTDRIRDFSSVDVLELTALDVEISDVAFTDVGNNTVLSVDINGTAYDLARLDGVNGLNVQDMFDDGLIII